MKRIKIKSPAKINLGLNVIEKRADGYHNIETVFQMINLYDDIIFTESSNDIELHSSSKDIPLDDGNLSYRAARLLREKTGIKKGVSINIDKHIPVSAGLGGGSSNAAVTLLGLNYIWDLKLPRNELISIAKSLGADVPFFLSASCAYGTGRGDEIQNLPVKSSFYVILLNSGCAISTKWVYANLRLNLTRNKRDIKILKFMLVRGDIEEMSSLLFNDLESVVEKKYGIINEMKEALLSAGALGAAMSGSGSTVFGVFKDYPSAEYASSKLKGKGWFLFLAETLTSLQKVYPEEVIV